MKTAEQARIETSLNSKKPIRAAIFSEEEIEREIEEKIKEGRYWTSARLSEAQEEWLASLGYSIEIVTISNPVVQHDSIYAFTEIHWK